MSSADSFQEWVDMKIKQCTRSIEEKSVAFLRELEEEEAENDFKKYGGKEFGSAEEQPKSA